MLNMLLLRLDTKYTSLISPIRPFFYRYQIVPWSFYRYLECISKQHMFGLNFRQLLKKVLVPAHVITCLHIKVPKRVVRIAQTWLDIWTPWHHQYSVFLNIFKEKFYFLFALQIVVLRKMPNLSTIIAFIQVAILGKWLCFPHLKHSTPELLDRTPRPLPHWPLPCPRPR